MVARRAWFVALVGGCLLTAGCTEDFKEFSPDGKFKVLFPGKPKEETHSFMGVSMQSWGVNRPDGSYAVAVSAPPVVESWPASPEARIDILREHVVADIITTLTKLERATLATKSAGVHQIGTSITKQEAITLAGKYPGRQIEANVPIKDTFLVVRLFLVGDRVYHVRAAGPKSFLSSPEVTRFFQSLQIVIEPPAPPANPEPNGPAKSSDAVKDEERYRE